MQRMEILLVEDNAGDAVLIRQILAEASIPVNLHIAGTANRPSRC